MLDRFLRKLGYVPASAMRLIPDDAARPSVSPLHQHHADGFDRSRADVDPLCAWHADGEGLHYAIGRDDWAPLAVAGFCLSGNEECRAWLDEALRARVWIPHDMLESWCTANRTALDGFGVRIDGNRPPPRAAPAPVCELEIVPLVGAFEMAELFALTWKRQYLGSPFLKLGDSVAYTTLAMHHSVRLAAQANEHALDRVIEWLALWLEARGLNVNRRDKTVYLPGYQALFFRSDAEMWP